MFGMGLTEILLILAVALVIIGPKNLPKVARKLGSLMGQVQRMTSDLSRVMREESAELTKDVSLFDEKATVVKGDLASQNQDSCEPVAEEFVEKEGDDKEARELYDKGDQGSSKDYQKESE